MERSGRKPCKPERLERGLWALEDLGRRELSEGEHLEAWFESKTA